MSSASRGAHVHRATTRASAWNVPSPAGRQTSARGARTATRSQRRPKTKTVPLQRTNCFATTTLSSSAAADCKARTSPKRHCNPCTQPVICWVSMFRDRLYEYRSIYKTARGAMKRLREYYIGSPVQSRAKMATTVAGSRPRLAHLRLCLWQRTWFSHALCEAAAQCRQTGHHRWSASSGGITGYGDSSTARLLLGGLGVTT